MEIIGITGNIETRDLEKTTAVVLQRFNYNIDSENLKIYHWIKAEGE